MPHGIVTADFDLREHEPGQMSDESAQGYYFRDQKSVVTRIPQAFGGRGLYIGGDQKKTFPFLYRTIIEALSGIRTRHESAAHQGDPGED